ncbi:hypothetical protein, partial [Aeromonas bestiarum]|uniref:hypothetical protein n=1 Tax=Aeromonas bestiarum TaxID=105751 RepID=UPI003D1CDE45
NFCKIAKPHIYKKLINHLILKEKTDSPLADGKSGALLKCSRKVGFSPINHALMFSPYPMTPHQKL